MNEKGETALEVALKSRHSSLARTLVEHRADLSAKDPSGLTLLQSAIMKGDSYSAEFIVEQLENGSKIQKLSEPVNLLPSSAKLLEDIEGCTALHLVAKHKTQDMIAIAGRLLKTGCNPNLQDRRGWYKFAFIFRSTKFLFFVRFLFYYFKFLFLLQDGFAQLHLRTKRESFGPPFRLRKYQLGFKNQRRRHSILFCIKIRTV